MSFPPVYAPARILMLYVTEDCNLRCTYCFVEKKPRHMTAETMRKAIDWFLDRNVSGAEYRIFITFFGGEPFSRLDLVEEAVAYARQPRPNAYKSVAFTVTTNGTVATSRVERLVRDAQMGMLVSLDGGHGANAQRPFLSGKPSYEHVARNLPKLVQWSSDVVVRMTFHTAALDLVDNVRHVLALGAPSIVLAPVVEADWTGHEERLEAQYQGLADFYVTEARAGRILPLEITRRLLRDCHLARQGQDRPSRPCGVGASLIGVDPDGNVMPCHRFLYRPQDRLGTVDSPQWSDERWRYVHLSAADILGCDGCEARPVCGGGCRAAVLQAGGTLYGTHPGFCLTMRAHARAVYRIYETLTAERNPAFLQMLASPTLRAPALAELAAR